jgi:hypothetical protein
MAPSRFRTALALSIALGFALSGPFDVFARGGSGYAGRRSSTSSSRTSSSHTVSGSHWSPSRGSIKCESCPRDSRGKSTRGPNALPEFKQTNPKLPACHQCEVDRIVLLSKDGRDDSGNMSERQQRALPS